MKTISNNIENKITAKVGTEEYFKQILTATFWGEKQPRVFQFHDVHHDCKVSILPPTHDGTEMGEKWKTFITCWGDPTHDGTPRKEDAEPTIGYLHLDYLCNHLNFLYTTGLNERYGEKYAFIGRPLYNAEEISNDQERAAAIVSNEKQHPCMSHEEWDVTMTAKEFFNMKAEKEDKVIGQRYHYEHKVLLPSDLYVAGYVGDNYHVLIYKMVPLFNKVTANVVTVEYLNRMTTKENGWFKTERDEFMLNDETMHYLGRIRKIEKHFGQHKDGWHFIKHAIEAVCNRLGMSNCLYSVEAWDDAATMYYNRLKEIFDGGNTAIVRWSGYSVEKLTA